MALYVWKTSQLPKACAAILQSTKKAYQRLNKEKKPCSKTIAFSSTSPICGDERGCRRPAASCIRYPTSGLSGHLQGTRMSFQRVKPRRVFFILTRRVFEINRRVKDGISSCSTVLSKRMHAQVVRGLRVRHRGKLLPSCMDIRIMLASRPGCPWG
jgi:hypothetical protein